MISPLAYVDPKAKLADDVNVMPFAYIEGDVEIGEGSVIMPYTCILDGARIGKNNKIYSHCVIGAEPQSFHYEKGTKSYVKIGDDNTIRENVVIARSNHEGKATVIGNGNFLMDKVHVCHDVQVHDHCVLGISVSVAGDCDIHSCTILSSGVVIQHKVRTGIFSLVQSGCRVQKDVPPYVILGGNPAGFHGINAVVLKHENVTDRILRHIANAYRLIYSGNFSLQDSVIKIKEQIPMSEEIENITHFIESSELDIVRQTVAADK